MRKLGHRVAACVALAAALPVAADTFTWTGNAGTTAWTDEDNWFNDTAGAVSGAPGLADDAVFNTDALTGGGSVLDLFNNAVFTVNSSDLTIAGSIDNAGTLTSQGFSSSEAYNIDGAVTLSGLGELVMIPGRTQITGAGTLTHVAGHTIRGGGTVLVSGLVNQSLIRAEGGTLNISGTAVDNTDGNVEIADGALLQMSGGAAVTGGTVTGEADAGAGGALVGGGTFSDLTTAGVFKINSSDLTLAGTLTNNGTLTSQGLSTSEDYDIPAATTLQGAGEILMVANRTRITGAGTLTNAPTHTIRGAGTLLVANLANRGALRAEGGTLTASGTTIDNASGDIDIADGGTLQMSGGAVITGGTITGEADDGGGGAILGGGTIAELTTAGTLEINSSDLTLGGNITNNGILTSRGLSTGEEYDIPGAATLQGAGELLMVANRTRITGAGTLTNAPTHTIRGAGTLLVANLANRGALRAEGGTLIVSGTLLDNAEGAITIADAATLRLTGGAVITGGTITGEPDTSGSGATLGGGTLADLTTAGTLEMDSSDLTLAGTINNTGTLTSRGLSTSEDYVIPDAATLQGAGKLLMIANRTRVTGTGTLTNAADHTLRGAGSVFVANLANRGAVRAEGGTLNVIGTMIDNAGGQVVIADGATLGMSNGAVLNGGTLTGEPDEGGAGAIFGGGTIADLTTAGTLKATSSNISLDGTITNTGTLTSRGVSTSEGYTIPDAATLTGAGEMVLIANRTRITGPGTLTHAAGHTIRGAGMIRDLTLINDGLITADGPGQPLMMQIVTATGSGDYLADGGELDIDFTSVQTTGGVTVTATGELSLNNGSALSAGTITLEPGGTLSLGSTDRLGADAFIGDLAHDDGRFAPGVFDRDATLTGAYDLGFSGELEIELGGTAAGAFDHLTVTGGVALAGELVVELVDGFGLGVSESETFEVLTAEGGLTGAFRNVANGRRVRTADGLLSLVVNYGPDSAFDPDSVVLSLPRLVGDINGDGFVGAADLDLLLGVWNQNVTLGEGPDLSEDGFVGAADLDLLLGNWNAGVPAGSLAAVPEPGTLALLGLSGVAGLRRRR